MRNVLLLLFTILFWSCSEEKNQKQLEIGIYRAVLDVQDAKELPFNFEVTSPQSLKISNAEEVITVDEITYRNDSVFIKAPVFEGVIAAKFEGSNLQGHFIKESLDRSVPFSATYNNPIRFKVNNNPKYDISGVWETVFSKDIAGDEYIAKGLFEQKDGKVTGTFRTTTGDYRYLEGVMDGDQLKLSTFDGAHAFLFSAKVSDSAMTGTFYSGNHWKEPFVGKRNSDYELPDANELTFLKPDYEQFEFSFPNEDGKMMSLSDKRFKNKVTIVQIMGTWCPNCLDESKFYSHFYKANKEKQLEFVALAFEYAKTEEKAFKSIQRLKDKLQIEYPVLLAQYGTANKAKAQEKLPMLNHIISYPTTVFIDKTGQVRKIHTGFNGPATGEKYLEFKSEFENFVTLLLEE